VIDIPPFRVHCSAIGQIMTESRGKTKAEKIADINAAISTEQVKHDGLRDGLKIKENAAAKLARLYAELEAMQALPDIPELSQTAKSYCEKWLSEQLYARRKEFTSRQTEKGNAVELAAMDFAAGVLGWGFVVPQDQSAGNDYIVGKCDILRKSVDVVHDIKSSWDCFTFPLYEDQIPDSQYVWQVQGYCALYGVNRATVVYCLMDTPDDILHWLAVKEFGPGYIRAQFDELKEQHRYSHLPNWLRIREYEFEYDAAAIERVYARVIQCREYINTLVSKLEAGKFYTKNDQQSDINRACRARPGTPNIGRRSKSLPHFAGNKRILQGF
jgi:hypothetical protein